jgi:hypothetical protein
VVRYVSVFVNRYAVGSTYKNDNDAHNQEASFNIKSMLAHESADSLCDTNSSLANDDDSKQTHTLHEMRLLEAQHSPATGDGNDRDGFESGHNIPDEVNKSVVIGHTLERWRHSGERTHGNGVDEEHEAERKVQFGIACSPCEELQTSVPWIKQYTNRAYKNDQVL